MWDRPPFSFYLQADLAGHVPLVSRFIGLEPTIERVTAAVTNASRHHMLAHAHQFDESWTYARLLELNRHKDPSSFVPAARVNTVGRRKDVISQATLDFMDRRWQETIGASTGLCSYDALCQDIRQSNINKKQQQQRQ
eukprot:UC1_evm2s560